MSFPQHHVAIGSHFEPGFELRRARGDREAADVAVVVGIDVHEHVIEDVQVRGSETPGWRLSEEVGKSL